MLHVFLTSLFETSVKGRYGVTREARNGDLSSLDRLFLFQMLNILIRMKAASN